MVPYVEKTLSGWGGYPRERARVYRPEKERELLEILAETDRSLIARGLGRSYGDAALNGREEEGRLILNTHLNRMLSFDEERGLLCAEAGVSLKEILDTFVPRGFFLPVTPGTKYVTLGGAVANDVHGKNHHRDGSFSNFVQQLKLLTPQGEILTCSREQHTDVFWATVGGIGLTGYILEVSLALIPIESSYMRVHYEKAANLEAALQMFEEGDRAYPYSVAWIDCLAPGTALGRSVLMRGAHLSRLEVQLARLRKTDPLRIQPGRRLSLPFYLPGWVLNRTSMRLFNTLYNRLYRHDTRKVVNYDAYFYPLDAILYWNRIYGRRGFIQYQAVFPHKESQEGLTRMLEFLQAHRVPTFLAVLKGFGEEGEGYLSFPRRGYTLALDIPIYGDELFGHLRVLDELVLHYEGRVYLAKDATLNPDLLPVMYPHLETFREVKRRLDPEGQFTSSMARRLKIVEE